MKWLLRIALPLLGLLLLLELVSHWADAQADPARIASHQPGFWEKCSRAYLDPAAEKNRLARTEAHPYLGYALKPGWQSPPGAPQQCSHNALGLRGKETTWEKPAGTFRILTLGGSSVYGQSESRDAAVWSQRLEDLANEGRGGPRIEVVNGGCSGYTSFEMLAQLAFRGVHLDPDLVLIYETVNDMRAALYTAGASAPARDNTHWRLAWPVDRPSGLETLLENSRSYLIFRRYFTNYVQTRADLGFYAMVNYDPKSDELYCNRSRGGWPEGRVPEQGLANYRHNLESMLAVAQADGAEVFIATQALMEWDFAGRECPEIQIQTFRRIQSIQREVAAARGARLGETGAAIEAADAEHFGSTGKHLFKNDVHPFDEGSELIARTILGELRRQGALP
jgi:lysophospholipase L1-like esterase